MKVIYLIGAPVLGGLFAWGLSGSPLLGLTILAALAIGNAVMLYRSRDLPPTD